MSDEATHIFEAVMRALTGSVQFPRLRLQHSVGDGSSLKKIEGSWIAETKRPREDLPLSNPEMIRARRF